MSPTVTLHLDREALEVVHDALGTLKHDVEDGAHQPWEWHVGASLAPEDHYRAVLAEALREVSRLVDDTEGTTVT